MTTPDQTNDMMIHAVSDRIALPATVIWTPEDQS